MVSVDMEQAVDSHARDLHPAAPIPARFENFAELYQAQPSDNGTLEGRAAALFKQSLKAHQESFSKKNNISNAWITQKASLADVLSVLKDAQAQHETSKAGRFKVASTAFSIWTQASERIIKYGQVIDTFVSSNPETAALVWGSLRFVFAVTLNHQKLSRGIAETVSDVLEAMTHVDVLALRLYPTQHILEAAAQLCALVMEFCRRATEWYHEVHRSFAKKLLRSLEDAWSFKFEDIKLNIDKAIRRLHDRAAIAHQAETRANYNKVQELSKQVGDVVLQSQITADHVDQMYQMLSTLMSRASFATGSTTDIVDPPMLPPFNLERALRYLEGTLNPQQDLKHQLALQKRRRGQADYPSQPAPALTALYEWLAFPTSSLVRLQCSMVRRANARNYSLDVITAVKAANLPVAWVVTGTKGAAAEQEAMVEILKSMCEQIIQQHQETFEHGPVSEEMLSICEKVEDWTQLFVRLLRLVPYIVVVFDVYDKAPNISGVLMQIWDEMIFPNTSTTVKMLLVVYQNRSARALSSDEQVEKSCFEIDLNRYHAREMRRGPVSRTARGQAHGDVLEKAVAQFAKLVESGGDT